MFWEIFKREKYILKTEVHKQILPCDNYVHSACMNVWLEMYNLQIHNICMCVLVPRVSKFLVSFCVSNIALRNYEL